MRRDRGKELGGGGCVNVTFEQHVTRGPHKPL